MWALGADGAYSTTTDMVAFPRLRRDMRSASRSASRDRSEPADGSGDGSDDGSDDVTRAFAAGVTCSRRSPPAP